MTNFSILITTFVAMLKRVTKIIPARTSLPILENVRIAFKQGKLSVEAFTFNEPNKGLIRVHTETVAEGTGEGVFAPKIKGLLKSLSLRKSGNVDITVGDVDASNDNTYPVNFAYGNTSVDMDTPNHLDLPAQSEPDGEQARFRLSRETLLDVIKRQLFAVSKDEHRSHMMGMLFRIRPNAVGITATNGHMLFDRKIALDMDTGIEEDKYDVIVPGAGLKFLQGFLDRKESDVEIVVYEQFTQWIFGNEHFVTTVDIPNTMEKYPGYEQVIPQDQQAVRTVLDVKEFLTNMKEVLAFANKSNGGFQVLMEFGAEHEVALRLTHYDQYNVPKVESRFLIENVTLDPVSDAVRAKAENRRKEEILDDVFHAPASFITAFNPFYFQEVLAKFDGEVTLETSSPSRASIIRLADEDPNDNTMALLMPVSANGTGYTYAEAEAEVSLAA